MKHVCPDCGFDQVLIPRTPNTDAYCVNCPWKGSVLLLKKVPGEQVAVSFLDKIDFTDQVNHPKHYNKGKIEVIEFIEDQKLNFHLTNAVKYICRSDSKGTEAQDLEKAIWYIRRHLETLKPNPRRPNDMKESQ